MIGKANKKYCNRLRKRVSDILLYRMNEKFLLRLALLISIIGLILLFFISKNITVNDTTIEKITNEEIEGDVVGEVQLF